MLPGQGLYCFRPLDGKLCHFLFDLLFGHLVDQLDWHIRVFHSVLYEDKPATTFGADNGAFQDVLKEFISGKPVEKKRDFEPFVHKYVWKGQLAAGGSDQWRTYSRRAKPFRPTAVVTCLQ